MEEHIKKAVEIVNNGGVVIFPTDTAFGIGCRIDNESAVKRLFEIRKRPINQPTPVLVDGIDMARRYVQNIDLDVEEKLMKRYWPGGLTIILEGIIGKIPQLVRGGGSTIGLRMPDHETTLSLIHRTGVPILGPSANFHGKQTPYKYEDLDKELTQLVDYVIPGECKTKEASTVIDCTQKPWKTIRFGAVIIEE